jgi:hypothetical protein
LSLPRRFANRDVGLCCHLGKSRLELGRFPHAELVKLRFSGSAVRLTRRYTPALSLSNLDQ